MPSSNSSQASSKREAEESAGGAAKQQKTDFAHELSQLSSVEALTPADAQPGVIGDQIWDRPGCSEFDESMDLTFQQIDAEEATKSNRQIVVRMFGVTAEGRSVMCDVVDFKHYFYVPAPVGFQDSDVRALANALGDQIDHIEIAMKQSLWGYYGDNKSPFLKIVASDPASIPRLRRRFEDGDTSLSSGTNFSFATTTYDRASYVERLTVDCKISGMSWITLPARKFKIMKNNLISRCQLEVEISYKDLVAHPSEGEWIKSAPLRILSFDIECAGRKGIFPEAEIDPVIQIANMVQIQGQKAPFVRNVFTVGDTAPIVGSDAFNYEDEKDMLLKWRDFVNAVDPDVIIGYNIGNFDIPYLIDRASALKLKEFPYFGRLKYEEQTVGHSNFTSKAFGSSDNKITLVHGRIQIDMLQYIRREFKLRSYTLNSVSSHFLGEQKEDVHHSIITELQNGNADSRYRLAVYCLKDAYLPLRLLDKLMTLVNMTEMSRVAGVPISYLLFRGQQVKVMSQLFRKALQVGMVIPNMKSEGSSEEQYEGATVIEPVRGFYNLPIATLDFSSLYPSIMMAHNLCYTSILDNATIDRLGLKVDEDYIVTPNGDKFVKATKRKGILPIILEEFLSARKRAKQDLKNETDPFKRAVLDGRQLALKISANSVYGFTGATVGRLPCLAISSSVTSYGRQMIEQTKKHVESTFSTKNGYKFDAQVIYGDTDSVMVKFGTEDLGEAMKLGQEAAELVSTTFQNPIKLEFEKVYFPYLLVNKKRYAGLYWTNTEKYDKMDTKGIETVRRDNCRLVQTVIETVLNKILIDRDPQKAQDFVRQAISDLLQNRIDLSQLVITKQLTRADYANKQAHVELAERMRKRDPGSAPALGDRVAYVIVKGGTSGKNYDKSEDPMYVLEHNIPIDTNYYLDSQLSKPLLRIFEPVLGQQKASQLLSGAHTSKIFVSTPKTGALMKFAVKTEQCKACKRPLKGKEKGPVCSNCTDRLPEIYSNTLSDFNELQVKFATLWTQCQRCQGSLHQDVLCSSKDCPIFFMRIKAQKDLAKGEEDIAKFADVDW